MKYLYETPCAWITIILLYYLGVEQSLQRLRYNFVAVDRGTVADKAVGMVDGRIVVVVGLE